jgi:2-dehydro-3-deoxyphosphooctonate aldolase (KDO 8-P synthase)
MQMRDVRLGNVVFNNRNRLVLIAGPCVIENEDLVMKIASQLRAIGERLGIGIVFKASFDKANRTSVNSFRGPGLAEGLRILAEVKKRFSLPLLTDVHLPEQADAVAQTVDILQVPAFLVRQTDLLEACAKTGKAVNLKKAQFLSPAEMRFAVEKVEFFGNRNILLTERGTFFGYNNLVVDLRSLEILGSLGYPVVFDATHSVQNPGAGDGKTSGKREFIPVLARGAVAAGVAGIFMEVHPDPDRGLSDAANMFPLDKLEGLLKILLKIDGVVKNNEK